MQGCSTKGAGIKNLWILGIFKASCRNKQIVDLLYILPFYIFWYLTEVAQLLFCARCVNPFLPGLRSWQMAETRENDVRGPGWELQVRLFSSTLTCFFSSLQNLIAHFICSKTREWETAKRMTRMVNTADGECLGFRLHFSVRFAGWQSFTRFARRCRDHRPAEADAPQRLCGDGEAVPPTFGMLHSGVSCRSDF